MPGPRSRRLPAACPRACVAARPTCVPGLLPRRGRGGARSRRLRRAAAELSSARRLD
jgi:hypothetical protein